MADEVYFSYCMLATGFFFLKGTMSRDFLPFFPRFNPSGPLIHMMNNFCIWFFMAQIYSRVQKNLCVIKYRRVKLSGVMDTAESI